MLKILTQKDWCICNIYILNSNETLTNDIVNLEQPATGHGSYLDDSHFYSYFQVIVDNTVHEVDVDLTLIEESITCGKTDRVTLSDTGKQLDDAKCLTQIATPQIHISIDENGIITAVEEKIITVAEMNALQNLNTTLDESNEEIACELNEEGENDNFVFDNVVDYDLDDTCSNFALPDGNSFSEDGARVDIGKADEIESVSKKDNFPCSICGKNLTSEYFLKGHVVALHSIGCVDCNIVNYETKAWKEGLKASDKRKIACTGCNKSLVIRSHFGYQRKDILGKLKRTQNGGGVQRTTDGLYMCIECGKMTFGKLECEQHQIIHKGTKPSVCHICGQAYTAESSLRKHLKGVHRIMMKKGDLIEVIDENPIEKSENSEHDDADDDAAVDYDNAADYAEYNDTQYDDNTACFDAKGNVIRTKACVQPERKTYDCKLCGKQMATEYTFRGHIVAVHTIGCLDCFTVNVESEPWSEDMKAQDKREISCTGCNKTLILWTQLGYKDNRTKLGGGWKKLDNGMYICTECGKLFSKKTDCRDHQISHKETQYYTCKICKKKYAFITTLRHHLKEVHGKRLKKAADRDEIDNNVDLEEVALCVKEKVAPSTINIGASQETLLNDLGAERGRSVGFDLDKYVSFALGADLQKKEKTKAVFGGEKYECTECSKFFGTNSQFKKHLKAVHGDFESECNICKKGFRRKSEMEGHKFQLHKIMCLSCLTVNSETEPWPDADFASATRCLTCTGCMKSLKLTNKPGPKTVKTTKGGGMFKKLPGRGYGCMECGKVLLVPNQCERHRSVHMK